MTLPEKIAALRGERKLSQGDLAEQLDVSRQSVSKWETGQAVPELDKIIRLADLFGVTVDELVREGDMPARDASQTGVSPAAGPETNIVYVERPKGGLTTVQILGVICVAGGAGLSLLSLGDPEVVIFGLAMMMAGVPLLLAKKHPFVIAGWLVWAVGCLLLCNPAIMGERWGAHQPFTGAVMSLRWLMADGAMGGSILLMILFFLLAYLALSVLTLVLPIYTGRLCWKWWKTRKAERQGRQIG